jgi:hypothetical protein
MLRRVVMPEPRRVKHFLQHLSLEFKTINKHVYQPRVKAGDLKTPFSKGTNKEIQTNPQVQRPGHNA